jgi:hypothetical protein
VHGDDGEKARSPPPPDEQRLVLERFEVIFDGERA